MLQHHHLEFNFKCNSLTGIGRIEEWRKSQAEGSVVGFVGITDFITAFLMMTNLYRWLDSAHYR